MTQPGSSNNFLSTVKGFTPVIDVLAQETSHTTAAVYGVVRRYCQMHEGVCRASVASIARRLGVHPKTARRHLKKLCRLGYLEDTTPDRRNLPHAYRDAGEAKIIALLQARTPGPTPETPTVAPSHPADPDRSPKMPDQRDKTPHHGRTKRPPKKEHVDRNKETQDAAGAVRRAARQDTDAVSSRHPAIRVFRSNAHRYPHRSWYRDVAETVGEGSDEVAFWGRVVKAWVGSGYNPTNVRGMLDWYRRGEIPSANGRSASGGVRGRAQSNLHRSIDAGVRLLQKEGEWPP